MTADYSDETLMAFADGLLDEPLFSAVAESVEQNKALAARLEQLVDGARLAREGFAPMLEPVSPALEASVRAMTARKQRKPIWNRQIGIGWLFPVAGVAGAVTAVVLALPMLRPASTSSWGGVTQSQLQGALDTVPSGGNQTLDDGSVLHAVASFTDGNGNLCREFEVPGYVMVACRAGTEWQVNMAVADGTDEGYRTASGLAVLDSYLTAIGASAPLLDAEERAALGRN